MGKPEEAQIEAPDPRAGTSAGGLLGLCAAGFAGIGRAFTLRCVLVLVLGACVFLSAAFWLPPFHTFRSGFVPDDPDSFSAEIQASLTLQKPISLLVVHTERLEYDIFEEIGLPNTKVSIISMRSLDATNSTSVVFGVLSDPKNASISSAAESVLRASLIELVLQQLNLSLTPSIFGRPSSFELLKFPGGITVVPVQSASFWEKPQLLFNFTLNNSIVQIQENLDQLKEQLKFGLHLRSDENVYVQMTNENGSTVAPPVTVQASVLSDFEGVEGHNLLPYRLRQLAQVIEGRHAKNLGLNHTVFGRVKQVRLSSYLQHSISSLAPCPSPSPSPSASPSPLGSPSPSPSWSQSPSPSTEIPFPASPTAFNPTLPPYAPNPSIDRHHLSPCLSCGTLSPSQSPVSYAPAPRNSPQPPAYLDTPAPSNAPSERSPCPSELQPPSSLPAYHPHPPSSSNHLPNSAIPPQHNLLGPTAHMAPKFSPLSPAVSYGSGPVEDKGGGKASSSPMSMPLAVSPSSSSLAPAYSYMGKLLIGLLSFLIFWMFCGPH